MKLEFYPEKKLRKEILEIVEKYLNLNSYRVFFFGSRVNRDNFLTSDIDIGIEGPEEIPAKIKLQIEEELDNLPTLYKFEVVDFRNATLSFREEALKHIEYVK